MKKGITQRRAFSMLIKGKKIRRRCWDDDDYIQFVPKDRGAELHARWTPYPYSGGEVAKDILYGLILWDDWELVDEECHH